MPTYIGEIESALKSGGFRGLHKWVRVANPRINSSSISVVDTHDPSCPYELIVKGKPRHKLTGIVGEGANLKAYLSTNGNVIKVVKDVRNARKTFVLSWAEKVLASYGIPTAKVLHVHHDGLFVEQEHINSLSLEDQYGVPDSESDKANTIEHVPGHITRQVLDHFSKAKRLIKDRGVWLDLKSANYHQQQAAETGAEQIINVDYVPRFHDLWRYFEDGNGNELTDEQFLDKFFHYRIRKTCCKRSKK